LPAGVGAQGRADRQYVGQCCCSVAWYAALDLYKHACIMLSPHCLSLQAMSWAGSALAAKNTKPKRRLFVCNEPCIACNLAAYLASMLLRTHLQEVDQDANRNAQMSSLGIKRCGRPSAQIAVGNRAIRRGLGANGNRQPQPPRGATQVSSRPGAGEAMVALWDMLPGTERTRRSSAEGGGEGGGGIPSAAQHEATMAARLAPVAAPTPVASAGGVQAQAAGEALPRVLSGSR
jgi:hypothetical protein